MNNLISSISGKKTYIVCALMIAYALIGAAIGKGFDTNLVLQALAIAGLRNGISNSLNK